MSPAMQWPAKMLPSVESSQPGTNIGRSRSAAASEPAVLRIDLVVLLEHARAQDLVQELVREELLARLVRALPLVEHGALDAADRLVLGDAGVGDAVQVLLEQLFLLLGREVAIVAECARSGRARRG